MGHKEFIADTARVLGRMFDGIEYRGFSQRSNRRIREYAGVPVWNGLTDEWHPTQMLADMLTIEEHFGYLKGLKFVYMGDARTTYTHSMTFEANWCKLCSMRTRRIIPRRTPSRNG